MRKTLGVLAVAGLLSVGVSAATITETASFGPTSTPFSGQVIPIQEFNPSLGILNSIEFIVTASTSGEATITNNSGHDGTYTSTIVTTTMTLFDPLGTSLVSAAPDFVFTNLTVKNGQTASTGNVAGLPVTNNATITSGLGIYEGTGMADFTFDGRAVAFAGPGPTPFRIEESSTGSANIQVVYNYSVVPEPSTLSLAGLAGFGLLGLALLRWRSKA